MNRRAGRIAWWPLAIGWVPVILATVLGWHAIDRLERQEMREAEAALQVTLDRVLSARRTGCPAIDALHELVLRTRHRLADVEGLGKFVREQVAAGRFPAPALFIWRQGRLVYCSPGHESEAGGWGRLITAIGSRGRAARRAESRLAGPIASRFGAAESLATFRAGNACWRLLADHGIPCFVMLETRGDGYAYAIVVRQPPAASITAWQQQRRHLAGDLGLAGSAVPDLDLWIPPPRTATRSLQLAYDMARRQGFAALRFRGRLWGFAEDRHGIVTCVALPLPSDDRWGARRSHLVLLALTIAGLIPLLQFRLETSSVGRRLESLRGQVVWLFALVTAMPTAAVILLAWMTDGELLERHRVDAFNRGLERIQQVEGGFNAYERKFVDAMREVVAMLRDQPFNRRRLASWARTRRRQRSIDHLEVYNAEGKAMFSNIEADQRSISQIFSVVAEFVVKQRAPHRLPPGRSERASQADLVVEELLESSDFGWAAMLERPDEVHAMQMARVAFTVYWHLFADKRSGPAMVVGTNGRHRTAKQYFYQRVAPDFIDDEGRLLEWSGRGPVPDQLWEDFVRKRQPRRAPPIREPDASPPNTATRPGSAPPDADRRTDSVDPATGAADRRPAATRPRRDPTMLIFHLMGLQIAPRVPADDVASLIDLGLRCDDARGAVQRELSLSTGRTWVTARAETAMGWYVVMVLIDSTTFEHERLTLRNQLAAGLLLALLVAVLAGYHLRSLVLTPVDDLQRGIAAIRQRDTRFRLHPRRPDEFGALAAMFNHLLGELRELELAATVQATLMPSTAPTLQGYTVAAATRTATDVGGDYHDLISLDPLRLLVVVGDVTGHGISAALAMSMARAAVAWELQGGYQGLPPVMIALNDVFYTELRAQRKFMTLLLVELDAEAHRLRMQNAGHNYPVWWRHLDRSTDFVGMPGVPLGMKRKAALPVHERPLAPGDAVVWFTDGYTEAMMPDQTMIGEERLTAQIASLAADPTATATDLVRGLLRAFDGWRAPGPLGDDVTLVAIRRSPTG